MSRTRVTLKTFDRAGSAVASYPDMTQACAPRHTSSPTGRPVSRSACAAAAIAPANDRFAATT